MTRAIAQALFLIVGLLASGYTAFRIAERYVYQARETSAFDRAVALRKTAFAVAVPVAPGSPIGKIEIPRLNISAMVSEGVDERTLELAVGHIPETALPGQPGNVGVAAHRDALFCPGSA
jgi:sortase A